MTEQELLTFLRQNPNANTRDIAEAFPRLAPMAISNVLRRAQAAGLVQKTRGVSEDGHTINTYRASTPN